MGGDPDVGLAAAAVDVPPTDHVGLVASQGRGSVRCRVCGRGVSVVPIRGRPAVCVPRDGERGVQEILALSAAKDVLKSHLAKPLKVSISTPSSSSETSC